jgi:hypothetical protein
LAERYWRKGGRNRSSAKKSRRLKSAKEKDREHITLQ